MANKKNRKPSKRGKKAKDNSLHCSSTTNTFGKKVKKWIKQGKDICTLVKIIVDLCHSLKPIVSYCKSIFELLWSAL